MVPGGRPGSSRSLSGGSLHEPRATRVSTVWIPREMSADECALSHAAAPPAPLPRPGWAGDRGRVRPSHHRPARTVRRPRQTRGNEPAAPHRGGLPTARERGWMGTPNITGGRIPSTCPPLGTRDARRALRALRALSVDAFARAETASAAPRTGHPASSPAWRIRDLDDGPASTDRDRVEGVPWPTFAPRSRHPAFEKSGCRSLAGSTRSIRERLTRSSSVRSPAPGSDTPHRGLVRSFAQPPCFTWRVPSDRLPFRRTIRRPPPPSLPSST